MLAAFGLWRKASLIQAETKLDTRVSDAVPRLPSLPTSIRDGDSNDDDDDRDNHAFQGSQSVRFSGLGLVEFMTGHASTSHEDDGVESPGWSHASPQPGQVSEVSSADPSTTRGNQESGSASIVNNNNNSSSSRRGSSRPQPKPSLNTFSSKINHNFDYFGAATVNHEADRRTRLDISQASLDRRSSPAPAASFLPSTPPPSSSRRHTSSPTLYSPSPSSDALASGARDHPSYRLLSSSGNSPSWSVVENAGAKHYSASTSNEKDSQSHLARHNHDNDSIIAVRNLNANCTPPDSPHLDYSLQPPQPQQQKQDLSLPPIVTAAVAPPAGITPSSAEQQDNNFNAMMDRHYPPQPSYSRAKVPSRSKGPAKASVSTILESAKRGKSPMPTATVTPNGGPLLGNTLNSTSSASYFAFPSSPGDGPPVEPSLFAYPSGSSKTPKSLKDSNASIHTAQTRKTTRTKSSERLTIRNARGEIEWKDMPPPPPPALPPSTRAHLTASPSGSKPRRTPSPYDEAPPRSRTRSNGAPTRGSDERRQASRPQQAEIPYKAIGGSNIGLEDAHRPRPRNRRRSTDDADGFHTADEDDLEAREWERKRERQMAADRLEVYRRQQAREEEERRARTRAERERSIAEALERERQAEIRKQVDREARRLARVQAELEAEKEREARRLAHQQAEKEEKERRRLKREEAQRRRIEAEQAAEEERIRKEKESAERRARRKQQAEERRKREEEEAARRAKEEAERAEQERLAAIERRKREEEEAIRRAEEERLAAIEAEKLAKEEAIRAAREAVLEKERQLVEAKRQIEEEDRAARRAGRREDRRAQRALAAGFPTGEIDPDGQHTDHEDDDEVFQDDDESDGVSEVFVDAGMEDDLDAEAKSATTDSMAQSSSNLDAPSSTDGSSLMPATPADEKALSIVPPHPSSTDLDRKSSSNGGHGQVRFAAGTNGEATRIAASPAEKIAPYKSDRFRHAVKVGARPGVAPAPVYADSKIVPSTSLLSATFASEDDGDETNGESRPGDDEIVQPNGPYREGGITYGRGWCAHGLADPSLTIDHRRYVRVPRTPAAQTDDNDAKGTTTDAPTQHFDEVMYSDLGELIWSATTPDVIARLISHLDYADVKALRQTSQSIRFALGQLAGREVALARFLSCVGYEAWTPTEVDGRMVDKDPFPLSFSDCEAFLLSFDLMPEYALVGSEYARAPHKMDPRYPRLARATTRAYNRVLTRLRMQPHLRVLSAQPDAVKSPWKPGRAGFFRVWVPSRETGGWLSDTELSRCERELFIAGVLPHLQKGDVVWDCAVGDGRNEGKYIFDGRYLRDLSFMFDRAGHLPSWLNTFAFAPSYYHNIVRSSDASQPVVYLDVLPFREQIVSTMRLVQDQVETFSPQGARYRVSKWLYRAVINVVPGTIISEQGVQVVDAGWHGKIVIETEGTAEHAKELISRCAGPAESAQTKARLLASVMDAGADGRVPKFDLGTKHTKGNQVETTSAWAIVRARSRPGLIWIRPMDGRERVVF